VVGTQHHMVLTWPWKGLLRSRVSFPFWSWFRPNRPSVASGKISSQREKNPAAFDAWLRAYQERLEECCKAPGPSGPLQ